LFEVCPSFEENYYFNHSHVQNGGDILIYHYSL
jgi:hypothetical protein